MNLKNNRKGEGTMSVIFTIVLILAIGAIIWQVVGSLYNRYEIALGIERVANLVNVSTSDEEVWVIADEEFRRLKLGSEHNPKNIVISRKYDKAFLIYSYVVKIGIPFTPLRYPWKLEIVKESK